MVTPVLAGTDYVVTEDAQSKWDLENSTCSTQTGVTIDKTARKATVNLKPGNNVTCTYENKKKTASLTVVKKAYPTDTGHRVPVHRCWWRTRSRSR